MALDFIARAIAVSAKNDAAQALSRSSELDLFIQLPTRTLDAAVTTVAAGGYNSVGLGSGIYAADALATAALAASHPRFCKASANGRYFRLIGDTITVEQGGATGVTGTNDQPAIQAALDYASAMGIEQVRFTKSAYEVWTPAQPTRTYNEVRVFTWRKGSVELVGVAGGSALIQKGPTGGNILTDTQVCVAGTARGHMLLVGEIDHQGNPDWIPALTLRNMIFDGTIPYDPATGNTYQDISHKGLCIVFDNVANVYAYNCTMKNFRGEIFYLGGTYPNYVYVENLTLHDSAQSCWNPGTLAKVMAVNINCYNSYQAAEILSGAGHTYVGGRFAIGNVFVVGTAAFDPGYPYSWPFRPETKAPPFCNFIDTTFEKCNIGMGSWCRGSVILIDSGIGIYAPAWDIDLDVTDWCDTTNGTSAINLSGPASLTVPIYNPSTGLPRAEYVPPLSNINIRLKSMRTKHSMSVGQHDAFLLYGMIDRETVKLSQSGRVREIWHTDAARVAGFAYPKTDVDLSGYPNISMGVAVGTTQTIDIFTPFINIFPDAAGTATVNLPSTYLFAHGQKLTLMNVADATGRMILIPQSGASWALPEARTLYRPGDFLELEYNQLSEKWRESRYVTSQQLVFRGSTTYDAPSIAAGASATTTVTATGASLGDYVDRISLSIDTAGIILSGRVSAADTVTVTLQNPTGSVVDLASATLAVEVQRK